MRKARSERYASAAVNMRDLHGSRRPSAPPHHGVARFHGSALMVSLSNHELVAVRSLRRRHRRRGAGAAALTRLPLFAYSIASDPGLSKADRL